MTSSPRWVACKLLGPVWKDCVRSGLGGLRAGKMSAPPLPGEDWVGLRTRIGGICGTDLAIIGQKQPPDSILQAFGSMPMVLGHEGWQLSARWGLRSIARGVAAGVRGADAWLHRSRDQAAVPSVRGGRVRCVRKVRGRRQGETAEPPAGTSIGYNSATGGVRGEAFVVHVSQLVPLDDRSKTSWPC